MGPTALSLGNFDGVHLGHQALLRACRQQADAAGSGCEVLAVTFDPTPASVLRPGAQPLRIDRLDERIRRLRAAGADRVEVLKPTPEMLALEPEAFLERLVERFRPVAVVEGPDFRFGRARRGDHALMTRVGQAAGFQAIQLERAHVELPGGEVVAVSSSLCRELAAQGRVADVEACLGRSLARTARVVRGEQRGRTLGFPTLNLHPDDLAGFVIPAEGVYAALVEIPQEPLAPLPAAVSIGTKPTFEGTAMTVEAHLIDFEGDLYGAEVRVDFVRCLRGQRRFAGVDALREALASDVVAASAVLANRLPPATAAATATAPFCSDDI